MTDMDAAKSLLAEAQAAKAAGTTVDIGELMFHTIAELRIRVKDAGPRRWLVRGVWPASAYGVHAAEQKAQKSWNVFDLGVSVASGTPWLGHFEVDDPGMVLVFAGEGGEAAILRRVDAIAEHKQLDPDGLQLAVCERAPHLGASGHMAQVDKHLAEYRPKLVIVDPLYLAVPTAELGDIYKMGALLEQVQHTCADANAGLLLVHHYNRARGKGGSKRMSGAGPAEWGRVLIGADVISRYTNPETQETRVLTELDVIGGEVADAFFRVLRTIRAGDPADLDSPMRYTVKVELVAGDTQSGTDLPPAATKLLEAMHAAGEPASSSALVDWIADNHGHGLKRETVSRALNDLSKRGLADCIEHEQSGGRWPVKLWFPLEGNVSV
jgi:hypothetical protein